MNKEEAKRKVEALVKKYKHNLENKVFSISKINEENTKQYLDELFIALGWDITSNVVKEEGAGQRKRVDYSFNLNGTVQFLLEAKKMGENLDDHVNQALNYAFQKSKNWVVLTNFIEIRVYNAQYYDKAEEIRRLYEPIQLDDFINRFEDLWILSKSAFEERLIDALAKKYGKIKPKEPITKLLFDDFMRWRTQLTKTINDYAKENHLPENSDEATLFIDENVQRILDRILFIRVAEDRRVEEERLRPLVNQWETNKPLMPLIKKLFRQMDEIYDSGLFAEHSSEDLKLDSNVLVEIIKETYKSPNKLEYDFSAIDADILGNIYEQYLGHLLKKTAKRAIVEEKHAHRKEQGIYYTPTYIVDYIVKNTLGEVLKKKKLNEVDKIKIIDIACGSGSFLIKAFDTIDDYYKQKEKDYSQSKLDFESEADKVTRKAKILQNNIYGVDLDKQAVELAKLNLLLKAAERRHRLPDLSKNIKNGNSLIKDINVAGNFAFDWEEKFGNAIKEGGFDVILGNPPYFNLSKKDGESIEEFSEISDGIVNIAAVFIKKADKLLKQGGYLGFIVPKSILIVDSWKKIREFLLNERKIEKIQDMSIAFDDVGLEQVIIIFKKIKPDHNKMIVGELLGSNFEVEQDYFKKKGVILTCLNPQTLKLIKKIENESNLLGTFCEMPRGITVNSKEYSNEPKNSYVKVLGGTSVERYLTKDGNKRKPNRYLQSSRPEFKTKEIIFKKSRIVYQNVASSLPKIVATLVENQPTDDTLNNINNDEKYISNLDLLGILNSNLVTFYLKYGIINCSKLTIHLDKPYLGKIPIKTTKNLRNYVLKILELKKNVENINSDKQIELLNELKEIETKINNSVYELYNLTVEERKIVEDSVK